MMIARWLVAIAALYNFGGFLVDAVIPFTSRMHLWNPAWKPHAKFHNVQGMVMGMLLGLLSLVLLFAVPLTMTTVNRRGILTPDRRPTLTPQSGCAGRA